MIHLGTTEQPPSPPRAERWSDSLIEKMESQCTVLDDTRRLVIEFLARVQGEEPSSIDTEDLVKSEADLDHGGLMGNIESRFNILVQRITDLRVEVEKLDQVL